MQAGLGQDWPFETFPEFMDFIENGGCAINTAVFVGHTPIRYFVMGEDSLHREASEQEVEEMKSIIGEAMNAGALGFASSQVELHFAYDGHRVPSRVASLDEIDALVGAVAEAGGGHDSIRARTGHDNSVHGKNLGKTQTADQLVSIASRFARSGCAPRENGKFPRFAKNWRESDASGLLPSSSIRF